MSAKSSQSLLLSAHANKH